MWDLGKRERKRRRRRRKRDAGPLLARSGTCPAGKEENRPRSDREEALYRYSTHVLAQT